MNLSLFSKFSALILICSWAAACNQSAEKGKPSLTDQNLENILKPDSNMNAGNINSPGNIYDIWVLDSINKKPMNPADYARGTPFIEFSKDKNAFNGHTGCNGVNGLAKIENNKIIIDSLVATKEKCKDKGFEKTFLNFLKSNNVNYTIQNNNLLLKGGAGTAYIFRRIRR